MKTIKNILNFILSRKVIILTLLVSISFLTIQKSNCQIDSYIYLDNGVFMDGCDEFYPLVVPLPVNAILDVNDEYHISAYENHCDWVGDSTGCFSCGTDTLGWWGAFYDQLSTISDMGFNVVRVNGLAVNYEYDSIITEGSLCTSPIIDIQSNTNLNCFVPNTIHRFM